MIRALYTAASGMNAQQTNIDNIAHNLANVNTTGFKKARVEFEDLVYQQMRGAGHADSTSTETPIGLEIGLGTRAVGTARDFATGNLQTTNGPLDLAIEGQRLLPGDAAGRPHRPTRAPARSTSTPRAAWSPPRAIRSSRPITIPADATSVSISKDGIVSVTIAGQNAPQQLGTIELATFQNPPGLHAARRQLLRGDDRLGRGRRPARRAPKACGTLAQGFLEESNVSIVEEMINMILGQRAYEANSQVVRDRRRDAAAGQQPGAVDRDAGRAGPRRRRRCSAEAAAVAAVPAAEADVRAAIVRAVQARMGAPRPAVEVDGRGSARPRRAGRRRACGRRRTPAAAPAVRCASSCTPRRPAARGARRIGRRRRPRCGSRFAQATPGARRRRDRRAGRRRDA